MKYDIVYIVADNSSNNNFQLRFSLRSLIKHIGQQIGEIYIIGGKPNWIDNVKHLDIKDIYSIKSANIINKILCACRHVQISDNFVLMADDYFITRPFKIQNMPQYYLNNIKISNSTKHPYLIMVKQTMLLLKKKFNIEAKRFDKHYPCLINKIKCLETLNRFQWKKQKLIFKIIYHSFNQYNPVQLKDNKMKAVDKGLSKKKFMQKYVTLNDKICFSTRSKIPQNVKEYIMQLYPEKTKYQK